MSHPPIQNTSDQAPPKRSRARTIFGWVLIVIAVLMLLGNLARLTSGGGISSGDTAQATGALVGMVLAIGIPLVGGLLLLRRPTA